MIYDCFTFFNELDLLELRLQELKDVVDRFVLVEATKTFSNNPKSLCYQENKARFKDYQDKIIHIIVDDLPENPKDSWENQYFQRNAITRGLVNCSPDDIIMISDLDEIPRASAVAGFNGEIAFLEQNLYYYRLNCLCTTAKWAIPIILRYRNLTTPQEVRMYWYSRERRQQIPTIPNGGWHFSYLGDVEAIQLKLNSFSQQDFNTPEVNNKANIEAKIDSAQDLFDRPEFRWTFVKIDETYPRTIYENKYKYASYIKRRDLKSTIFFDQYSRYKSCAEIVESISDEKTTILDVGSGTDCLLGDFLPHLNISFVDPLIGKMSTRPPYMIGGDAFSPELNGRAFDCVVSIDALEHIPSLQRQTFIEKLCALANKAVVIAFPAADAGDASETDVFINNVYKEAYGTDYMWLNEHLSNGLPSLQNVLDIFKSQGFETGVRQNGHTPWMHELLPFTLCGLEIEGLKDELLNISKLFNEKLQCYDHLPPAYRQIVVATKPGRTMRVLEDSSVQRKAAGMLWDKVRVKIAALPFQKLHAAIALVRQEEAKIVEIERALADSKKLLDEKTATLSSLDQRLNEHQHESQELVSKLEQSGLKLAEKDHTLAAQGESLASLQSKLTEQDQVLAQQSKALADKDQALAKQKKALADMDQVVAQQNKALADRDQVAAQQNQALSDKDQTVAHQTKILADKDQTLAQQSKALADKDQALARQKKSLADMDQVVAQQKQALSDKDQTLAQQAQIIANKDETIAEHACVIGELQATIAALDIEVVEKTIEISALESDVVDLKQKISEQERSLAAQHAELQHREEMLAEYAVKTAQQRKALKDLEKKLEQLQMLLTERDTLLTRNREAIAELENRVADQSTQLDDRNAQIKTLLARIDELMNSLSWKITGPARTVAGFFTRSGK